MQTAANYLDMSAVDALWTLYRPQSQCVRDAFRNRIAQDETGAMSCHTEEEAKAMTLQRGRAVKSGRSKLIPHDEVMHELEQMLASDEA